MIDVYIIILGVILFILYKNNLLSLNIFKFLRINKLLRIFKLEYLFFVVPILTLFLERTSLTPLNMVKTFKVKKRKVSETTKKVVAANQKWHCNICNNMLDASYEVDHIVPLYKGGDNSINNLQALCRNCHGKKTIYDKLNN
tara:strand:+ start:1575 stop:2000 length:426 start_codon:yes stop_codon:yes gene_type:complete